MGTTASSRNGLAMLTTYTHSAFLAMCRRQDAWNTPTALAIQGRNHFLADAIKRVQASLQRIPARIAGCLVSSHQDTRQPMVPWFEMSEHCAIPLEYYKASV